jgi:hypothetical protein
MSIETLQKAILGDRERRVAQPHHVAAGCFACGRPYQPPPLTGDNSTRFCSDHCRIAYDNGLPAYEPPTSVFSIPTRDWKVIGTDASYYTPLLDRQRPKHASKPPADELIRPRRPCQCCGAPLAQG